MGNPHNLYPDVEPELSLEPAALITTDATGTSVDLSGYEGAAFVLSVGVITDGTHTIEYQESDNDSTFTAIAAADLVGDAEQVLVAANDQAVFVTDYVGDSRYVQVATVVTDSPGTGGYYTAMVMKRRARHKPAEDTRVP